jgi:hypothetical protein
MRALSAWVYLDSQQSGDNSFLLDARLSRSRNDNPELFWSSLEAGTSLTRVVVDGFPLRTIALALVPKDRWVHLYMEAESAFTADVHLFTRAANTAGLHVAMRARLASLAVWGRAVPLQVSRPLHCRPEGMRWVRSVVDDCSGCVPGGNSALKCEMRVCIPAHTGYLNFLSGCLALNPEPFLQELSDMALTSTYQLRFHTAALLAYYDLEQCMDDDAYSSYTVVDNLHAQEEQGPSVEEGAGSRTVRAHGEEWRNAWALPPPPNGPLWVRDDPGANTGVDREVSVVGERALPVLELSLPWWF